MATLSQHAQAKILSCKRVNVNRRPFNELILPLFGVGVTFGIISLFLFCKLVFLKTWKKTKEIFFFLKVKVFQNIHIFIVYVSKKKLKKKDQKISFSLS